MAKTKKDKTVSKATSKDDAVQRVIAQIEKQYGQGAIMQMDEQQYARIEGIDTGSLSLDIALGGRGIPRGRVTELFGPESSGKTTLALHVIANAQRAGGVAAFIDAEHALDTTWAKRLGVDVSGLLVSQPDTGEQALDIVEMLISSNSVDVIVVDSVAALTPKAEIEGEMGDSHMGLHARLMSQAMRKLTSIINKSKTSLVFINQIRMKIGVMFGNPETTTGGRALKFYSSVRIDLRRITTIKDAGGAIGSRVRA
ncbi:MAG: recombinase RecA, partial [Planctomycetota bacterium]